VPPFRSQHQKCKEKSRRNGKTNRELVIEAGMTKAEADCWELLTKAVGKFFELPKQHPTDASEVATAVHVFQNKLLARPTYRKYLELAKKNAEK
jgi:hypothetical protein